MFPRLMKTTTHPRLLATLLAVTLIGFPAILKAQSETDTAPASQGCKGGRHHHGGRHLAGLTQAERQQLKAAMKSVKEDPQLVAARQAVKDAQTKEAKQAARQAKRDIRRQLLLKADPSLQPVLEKIKSAHGSKEQAAEQE